MHQKLTLICSVCWTEDLWSREAIYDVADIADYIELRFGRERLTASMMRLMLREKRLDGIFGCTQGRESTNERS